MLCRLTGWDDGVSNNGEEHIKAHGRPPAGPSLISGSCSACSASWHCNTPSCSFMTDISKNLWKPSWILNAPFTTCFQKGGKKTDQNDFTCVLSQGHSERFGKVWSLHCLSRYFCVVPHTHVWCKIYICSHYSIFRWKHKMAEKCYINRYCYFKHFPNFYCYFLLFVEWK